MKKELTWPDVAPYYTSSQPPIKVVVLHQPPDGLTHFYLSHDTLLGAEFGFPDLREIDSITEEDAKAVLEFAHYYTDEQDCRELFLEHRTEEGDLMVWQSIMGCPAAFHYLIQRGYNVFNIPTYKEENP